MSKETEVKKEKYSPEEFINELYAQTLKWLTEDQKGEIITELEPQKLDYWDFSEGRHPSEYVPLSIDVEKGVLLKTQKHNFALVLGKRFRSRYDHEETLGLQFGIRPADDESKYFKSLSPVEKIRNLTFRSPGSYGSGDFYEHSKTRNIQTDAWADGYRFGGQEINRWGKDKLLTPIGIDACLEIVQRTARNAFI